MALVSINIGAMEKLVTDMTSAKKDLPTAVSTVRGRLDHVWLSTSSVDGISYGQPVWTWFDSRVRDLNRRLSMARMIANSTPGIPGTGVVTIDEDMIADLTDAQIKALVDELAGKMNVGDAAYGQGTDIDPRVLEILQQYGHDPYFAKALAEKVTPQQLDQYLAAVGRFRTPAHVTREEVPAFDAKYDQLLNSLGLTFGIASQGQGELAVPGMKDQWTSFLKQVAPLPNGSVQRITMVMSRGVFSTDLLLGVYQVLKEHEGDRGASAWGVGALDTVIDPDPSKSPEANILMDPMGALFQAMGNNPEAMRQVFATGPTVGVTTDSQCVSVNATLWWALRNRGADPYSMEQLARGLENALKSPPVEGQDAWQPGFGADVQNAVGAIEREVRIAEENKPPWWSAAGHFVLDLLGLVPLVGELADGLNAVWYGAEGNTVDAALSAAGAIPIYGWFSVGGKWVKRLLTADEIAALGKAVDKGVDIGRLTPGGTILSKTDMLDPTKFTPGTFLTPSEMRRYADRPWLQNIIAGNKFDDFMAPNYKYNEIYVEFAGNKSGKARLDSYVPGEQIISRKFTQLNEISLETAKKYVDELIAKYPVGAKIPDTPTNRANGLAGQSLDGDLVLQVPPQKGGTIPKELQDYIDSLDVDIDIIDVNGFRYTK